MIKRRSPGTDVDMNEIASPEGSILTVVWTPIFGRTGRKGASRKLLAGASLFAGTSGRRRAWCKSLPATLGPEQ